jgi:hypothetical protein
MKTVILTLALSAVAFVATPMNSASAEDIVRDPVAQASPIGAGAAPGDLPPPRSDNDPRPMVAAPMAATGPGITSQAGIGGTQAYGRVGVLELGGSAGMTIANTFNRVELAPSVGLFIADNLELSVIGVYSRFHVDGKNGVGGVSATEFKLLLEPSYHLPLSQTLFAFAGVGAGVAYLSQQETGFALQPRLGLNLLVGRSGILTPSFNAAYSTVDAISTPNGTVLGVQTSYGINIGYTVMY